MPVEIIPTPNGPKSVGPYSQCAAAGPFVFLSGQLGLDPATGKLAGDDVASQARQAFTNIKAILGDAGLSLNNIASADVFLVDLKDFAAMNAIYAEFMGDHKPCRTTVQVAALPLGGVVEIRVVAAR